MRLSAIIVKHLAPLAPFLPEKRFHLDSMARRNNLSGDLDLCPWPPLHLEVHAQLGGDDISQPKGFQGCVEY